MPVTINGQKYYRTAEVCSLAAISRATLFRWLKNGVLNECRRDRRGWRLYSESDLDNVLSEVNKVESVVSAR